MSKLEHEDEGQYMRRMVDLANRILKHVREAEEHHEVWFFAEVAAVLGVGVDDVAVACNCITFTHEAHTRDNRSFFLKSREEKHDDLQWVTGTGYHRQ